MDLSGVHIPAATPFDPVTGDVDVVAMRANARRWLEEPIRAIAIAGSTGEAVFLDRAERRTLVEAARDVIPSDRLLVAGTGAESTRATLRLTRDAADAGADAVLVMPPAFYGGAMTPEILRAHFQRVADESRVPLILYQVPLRFSTLDWPTPLVAELSRHENVAGIKDSRGKLDLVADLVEQCDDDFQVLVGSGTKLYASLELGAVGGVLGVANLTPGPAAGIVQAFGDGRRSEAGRLQEQVGPVHEAVVAGLGVPGVKAGLDLLGMEGGDPRPPLQPLDEDGKARVRDALEKAGLLNTEGTEP